MVNILTHDKNPSMTRIEVTCDGIIGYELISPKECVELAEKLLKRYVEVMT